MIDISKLPYRQGVQAYIINDKNELLLVCNAKENNFWKAPSGGIDPGELPEDTLHREVMEELGIKVTILKRCTFKNKYDWPLDLITRLGPKYRGQEQIIFIAKFDNAQKITIEPKEIKEYKWVKFDEVEDTLRLSHQRDTARKVLEEFAKMDTN